MKKKVLAVVLAMGCVFSTPVVSSAKETDYSYLEDMSTEELKDLDAAIHNLLGDTSNVVKNINSAFERRFIERKWGERL